MADASQRLLPRNENTQFYLASEDEGKENQPLQVASKTISMMASPPENSPASPMALELGMSTSQLLDAHAIKSPSSNLLSGPALSVDNLREKQILHVQLCGTPDAQRETVLSRSSSCLANGTFILHTIPPSIDADPLARPPTYHGIVNTKIPSASSSPEQEKAPSASGIPESEKSTRGDPHVLKQPYTEVTVSRWSTSSASSSGVPLSFDRVAHKARESPIRESFAPENCQEDRASKNTDDLPADRTKYRYTYLEFPPNATIVMRGGFGAPPERENKDGRIPLGECFRKFPPLSNKDYEYTTHARDPKFVYNPPSPIAVPKARPPPSPPGIAVHQDVVRPLPISLTSGEAQDKKDLARWRDKAIRLLPLGLGDNATEEERNYIFAEAYNLKEDIHQAYCWRCGDVHILFGPPDDLPARDTHRAYLPGWFPAEKYGDPWREFRDLWKEIIYLEESGRHFNFSLAGIKKLEPTSDGEQHAADRKWVELHGKCEGVWKCRNGPDATDAELSCDICHQTEVPPGIDSRLQDYIIRKDALVKWVHGCLKQLGRDDNAAAEGIVKRLGSDRIMSYPYYPGGGEKARASRLMPENLHNTKPLNQNPDHKGKALKVLGQMVYPGILRPQAPISSDRAHPYRYLSSSVPAKHPFHVARDWNNGTPSAPSELKKYRTTMEENFDPNLGEHEAKGNSEVKDDSGDTNDELRNSFAREPLSRRKPTFPSNSSVDLDSQMSARTAGPEHTESPFKVVYPVPDRTRARTSTVGDLENIAVGLSSISVAPNVSLTRSSQLD